MEEEKKADGILLDTTAYSGSSFEISEDVEQEEEAAVANITISSSDTDGGVLDGSAADGGVLDVSAADGGVLDDSAADGGVLDGSEGKVVDIQNSIPVKYNAFRIILKLHVCIGVVVVVVVMMYKMYI